MTSTITLKPGEATLRSLADIYFNAAKPAMAKGWRPPAERSRAAVEKAAAGAEAVYGVNTGFGKLAQSRIGADKLAQLQRNLILSHSCGVGAAMPPAVTRLMMALKLLSLARGASGIRPEVIELIEAMLAADVLPVIPAQGSVGASGDLAPLAHMAAAMIGEGEAVYDGQTMPAAAALEKAGLKPVELQAKEGLALINGTQFSCSYALAALFRTERLWRSALVAGALSVDASQGSVAPFRAEIHELRGQPGQIRAASLLRAMLEGSQILTGHADCDKVQDPYSLRCQPQVMGACLDQLGYAAQTLGTEANAVTDNPLVLSDGDIISGGNFHAEPAAFAADMMALVITEIGSISERRTALMTDPGMSGLPAFLTADPGLNSGFMIPHVTAAALVSENKQRSHPAVVDTIPTSANQEDHVSMAAHGARRLTDMADNLANIVGIELLAASQGIHMRKPLETSAKLQPVVAAIRAQVAPMDTDRFFAPDLKAAAALAEDSSIFAAAGDAVIEEL